MEKNVEKETGIPFEKTINIVDRLIRNADQLGGEDILKERYAGAYDRYKTQAEKAFKEDAKIIIFGNFPIRPEQQEEADELFLEKAEKILYSERTSELLKKSYKRIWDGCRNKEDKFLISSEVEEILYEVRNKFKKEVYAPFWYSKCCYREGKFYSNILNAYYDQDIDMWYVQTGREPIKDRESERNYLSGFEFLPPREEMLVAE